MNLGFSEGNLKLRMEKVQNPHFPKELDVFFSSWLVEKSSSPNTNDELLQN